MPSSALLALDIQEKDLLVLFFFSDYYPTGDFLGNVDCWQPWIGGSGWVHTYDGPMGGVIPERILLVADLDNLLYYDNL